MSMPRFMLLGVLLTGMSLFLPAPTAQAEKWGTPYDQMFEEAADRVKRTRAKDGTEIREFLSKGGVQVRQERKDGEINTSTLDMAYGPVMCFWEIAVTVRAALETCNEINQPQVASRLDETIGKVNTFISVNALEKPTVEQMQSVVAERMRLFRTSQAAPETGKVSCTKLNPNTLKFFNSYVDDVAKQSDKDYQVGIDKFLAVPRLPAMNPCL